MIALGAGFFIRERQRFLVEHAEYLIELGFNREGAAIMMAFAFARLEGKRF